MGYATLSTTLDLIAGLFQLPEDYKIVSAQYDMAYKKLTFLVESKAVEDVPEGAKIPELMVVVKVESLLGHPDYRKLTVTPEIVKYQYQEHISDDDRTL